MKFLLILNVVLLSVCTVFALEEGELYDDRDGTSYRTVVIDHQEWMAENLNMKTSQSLCYNNKAFNCRKYGSLYTWEEAQSLCPDGWHLPTRDEFQMLKRNLSNPINVSDLLKARDGWGEYGGNDDYGFSAMPGGYADIYGNFKFLGEKAYFWTATEFSKESIMSFILESKNTQNREGFHSAQEQLSVRCLRSYKGKASKYKAPKEKKYSPGPIIAWITDSRDGKRYKTVEMMDGHTWMAENLNYEVDKSECSFYEQPPCRKYGRLYTWAAAINKPENKCGAGYSCKFNKPVQGICPDGWRLPSEEEWEYLFELVGNKKEDVLKMMSEKGWREEQGTNEYAFGVFPTGYINFGSLELSGRMAWFWSSTEDLYSDKRSACGAEIDGMYFKLSKHCFNKNYKLAVRCIKADN